MSETLTIALDAMGGDNAPSMVLQGAAVALERCPEARFRVYGDEGMIDASLTKLPQLAAVTSVHHTEIAVSADDKPSQALRRSRDSSMGLAIQAVRDRAADVAVSAGNTGALMAMAKFMLKTMPGIERPALIGILPTQRGRSAMLDLGANVGCDEDNLVQFAIMGAAFASAVLGVERSTLGLINVGVEELKGNETVKTAAEKLRGMDLPFDFAGFVEGDAISRGTVDVFVTDGFSGNIALKATEGTARLVADLVRDSFRRTILSRLGYLLARPGLRELRDHLDANHHNGAVFLGLNGLVVKSHGSANIDGFASAINVAANMVRDDMLEHIANDLERLGATMDASREVAAS